MAVYEKQVRLPADVLEELGDHSGRWWSDSALEPIIVVAIRAYIKPAPAKRQPPTDSDTAGYQWKQLFLPAGTKLYEPAGTAMATNSQTLASPRVEKITTVHKNSIKWHPVLSQGAIACRSWTSIYRSISSILSRWRPPPGCLWRRC